MIKYYETVNNTVTETHEPKNGSWVSVVTPTEDEIAYLINHFGLDEGFVRSSLDEEETSRIETEEEQTLIIVDYAVAETSPSPTRAVLYYTLPMGIIISRKQVFTISLKDNIVLDEMAGGVIKNINTGFKTQFVLILLYRIATRYLAYLKQIDKLTSFTEKQLHKNMRNKELIQLLDLNKSLVYFSTSLKSNQTTLDRILRGRNIKLYEEDRDLLEDVLIEIKQAIEMSQIYTQIINSMTDSIGAIINNNVNTVMKNLTLITILMAIPSIIFSFYGMNVDNLPLIDTPWFSIFITVVLMGIAAVLLKRSSE